MKLSKEVKVGILAVVSLSMFYLGFNFLKGTDFFSSTNYYSVIYDDVQGLTVSNSVLLSGFSVGRVSKVSILQADGNKVRVDIELDNSIVIGEGAKAVLTSMGFLGTMGLVLEVGDISKPLPEGSFLEAAHEIGLVDEIKGKAFPIIDKVDSMTMAMTTLMQVVASKDKQIDAMIDDMAAFTKTLKGVSESRKIEKLLADFSKITQALNDEKEGLKPMLASFNQVADSLTKADFNATVNKLNANLDQMELVLAKMNDGEGTIDQLLNNDTLYVNLANTLYSLDQLLMDMKASPKKYVHFSLFGKKDKEKEKK